MSTSPVVSVSQDGGVRTITLCRAADHNAFNRQLRLELRAAFEEVTADVEADPTSVRAVVLAAEGNTFCVGQDLKEQLADMKSGAGLRKVVDEYNPMMAALVAIPVPVVAAISGPAAGAGWSLALACDFRIASERAAFKGAFVGVGLASDCGLSYTLTSILGPARTLEVLFADKKLTAAEAAAAGIVTQVVPGDRAEDAAAAFAATLATGPTCSYAEIKALVRDADAINRAAAREAEAQARLSSTADHLEAITAFLEKRPPVFQGK